MTRSTALSSYLARARALKKLAAELDAKESVWCQRGCEAERITLTAAIPTVHRDHCMLVFKAVTMEAASVESWFTATFYLSKKAMGWTCQDGASCPLGWQCVLDSGAGKRVYGVKVSDETFSKAELIARLEANGMATWAMERLGIEVPSIHFAEARKTYTSASAQHHIDTKQQ
jgi:hypothetical protein